MGRKKREAMKFLQPNMPAHRPWWSGNPILSSRSFVPTRYAVMLAIVAGVTGSLVGNLADLASLLRHQTNLVSTSNSIERKPDSVSGIAQRVLPSVVSISARFSNGRATGSGFVIDGAGYILTNNHVIESAARDGGIITVTLSDGRTLNARILGRDASYDLAVLKISATNLSTLQFGNSDLIQVGDAVLAVGSPLGLTGTVTSGIISAKNRAVSTDGGQRSESSFINALQTDAAINPGNSGGPLVDSTGAVIGVTTAIAALSGATGNQSGSIGLGFAIPINQARKTANQLIKDGKAIYPIMGISIDTSFEGPGAKIGSAQNAVRPGGPAAKAGLLPGDIITVFDSKAIENSDELVVAIRARNVGDRVNLTYLRAGASAQTRVVLAAGE